MHMIMFEKTRKRRYPMEFFKKYTSNTIAGSGNQSFFRVEDENKVQIGRVYYKVFAGGEYDYSLLFSNITDSTFSDGKHSHRNLILPPWTIVKASIGITETCYMNKMAEPLVMHPLTFGGKQEKDVAPGEFFSSDPIKLAPNKGDYLCLEIAFKGKMIPYHEESILPTFLYDGENWIQSKRHPFASMLGCTRTAEKRIAFLGDSITQGIGVRPNSYDHWNSVVAEALGDRYAYWNLGLGYGRADDAATDSAWLYKAKQNDLVVVCYGVNDIYKGYTAEQIKTNLTVIVDKLHEAGCEVVLQSVPPFDYHDEYTDIWYEVNRYVREELSEKAELFFDCAKYLQKSEEEPYLAPFGGHPNAEGCKIWGDALAEKMLEYLAK